MGLLPDVIGRHFQSGKDEDTFSERDASGSKSTYVNQQSGGIETAFEVGSHKTSFSGGKREGVTGSASTDETSAALMIRDTRDANYRDMVGDAVTNKSARTGHDVLETFVVLDHAQLSLLDEEFNEGWKAKGFWSKAAGQTVSALESRKEILGMMGTLGWTAGDVYAHTSWPTQGSRVAFPAPARRELWWPEAPDRVHVQELVVGDPGMSVPAAPDGPYCWSPASYTLEGPVAGLVPSWYGAAVDAVVPGQLDPDGTPADLGAYGGGLPRGHAMWIDGDGVARLYDCNDDDNTVYPGVLDAPFDGIDQDCAGDSDFDLDGDGHNNAAYHGDDCDDHDARRSPSEQEIAGNGIDDDCDGWIDEGTGLVLGSCSSAPAARGGRLRALAPVRRAHLEGAPRARDVSSSGPDRAIPRRPRTRR
ncbi:MAG: hypothetical protein ACI9MC_000844 [Kiritimatiellia bacterium]